VLLQQFTPFPVTQLLPKFDPARHRTNPREKFLDLIEQRVNRPTR